MVWHPQQPDACRLGLALPSGGPLIALSSLWLDSTLFRCTLTSDPRPHCTWTLAPRA